MSIGISSGMSPWHVIEQLYDSEIHAGLQTDWDGGPRVWIGSAGRYGLIEHAFLRHEFDDVAAGPDYEARRLFPKSRYARTALAANR